MLTSARLASARIPCYGSRLRVLWRFTPVLNPNTGIINLITLRNIFGQKCHELYSMQYYGGYALGLILALATASGQIFRPPIAAPTPESNQPNAANPNTRLRTVRPDAPAKDFVKIDSVTQESDGPIYHLRGRVVLETQDEILQADEVDYNEDTHEAEARGHVKYENFVN